MPFDGVIGLTDIERGDRVSDQTLIATLDDRSSILVDFNLPEKFAVRLAVGDPIAMAAWTDRDTTLQGKVHSLGSRIDPMTRTLRVKAVIANPDDRIRPGTSFDVRLSFKGRRYATIPEVAGFMEPRWSLFVARHQQKGGESIRRDRSPR